MKSNKYPELYDLNQGSKDKEALNRDVQKLKELSLVKTTEFEYKSS